MEMEFWESRNGWRGFVGAPPIGSPLPRPHQTAAMIEFSLVRFRYTLYVPTLGGLISAKKEHQKIGSDWPIGPLEVLTKEDQTAPYQTAPQKLH